MRICIFGCGYVGLPLAVALSKKFEVHAYDTDAKRINELKNGFDRNGEFKHDEFRSIKFTSTSSELKGFDVYIITVPTPLKNGFLPDLSNVVEATLLVAKLIKNGSYVIYESTYAPGTTAKLLELIEKKSGLKLNKDFYGGYSPERINPGDRNHDIYSVTKVVSGTSQKAVKFIKNLYSSVVKNVYVAESILVAEAAKIIENTQRDINIALMNELSIYFNKMGISTKSVLEAAKTKWNFIYFTPGLVGGHCIGVDPYYLAHSFKENGLNPDVILAGRRINDSMPEYIFNEVNKFFLSNDIKYKKVAFFGLTFKENVKDYRNSKAIELARMLDGIYDIYVSDPMLDDITVKKLGFKLFDENKKYAAFIFAVPHRTYMKIKLASLKKMARFPCAIFDIKWIFDRKKALDMGFNYFAL